MHPAALPVDRCIESNIELVNRILIHLHVGCAVAVVQVLTIGLVNVSSNGITSQTSGFAPVAIGSVLMACIFMGGHVSGGHYNPAVTFGVWLTGRGKITGWQSIGYLVVQLLGSFIASLVYWSISQETFFLAPHPNITHGHAFSAEAMYTFLLVSVVLNVATTKSQADNSFYGLAIGFTVLAGAISVGPISGGGFNPAVGFGPIIVDAIHNGSGHMNTMWIYWLGPLFGSVLAAIAFRITNHHKEYRGGADLAAIVDVRDANGADSNTEDVGLNSPGANGGSTSGRQPGTEPLLK